MAGRRRVSRGKTDSSIDKLKDQGKVHQHAQPTERISAVAKEYAATGDRTVVLSEERSDRLALQPRFEPSCNRQEDSRRTGR